MQFFFNLFRCTARVCDVTGLGNFARQATGFANLFGPPPAMRHPLLPLGHIFTQTLDMPVAGLEKHRFPHPGEQSQRPVLALFGFVAPIGNGSKPNS